MNGAVAGTFNYTANTGNPYYAGSAAANFGKRVGASNTLAAPGGVYNICSNSGAVQRRSVCYLDITKGSPNYTISGFTIATGNQALDWSFAMFLDGMEQSSTPTINALAMTASSSSAFANSEVAGIYDTFDLYWSKTVFALEVYSIAVYRMQ